MNEEERTLVEKVLAGNTEAFEPLVKPYRNDLLRLAFRMIGDWEDAREAAQECLLRAYKHLRRFDTNRSFKNWMLGILVNESRKIRRKKMHRSRPAEVDLNQIPNEQEIRFEQADFKNRVLACLKGLSERQRDIFYLRDIEDRTIEETARILGCSQLSVRVHLSRARKRIKEIWTATYGRGKEQLP